MGKYDHETAAGLAQASGIEPLEPYPGRVRDRWQVQCVTCRHEWATTLDSITNAGRGCPACAPNAGLNATDIQASLAASNLQALEPYPGNVSAPWRVRCLNCDREWTTNLKTFRYNKAKCRGCSSQAPLTPEQVAESFEAVGVTPLAEYPGNVTSPLPVRCRTCSFEWETNLNRVRRGSGCRRCANQNRKRTSHDDAATELAELGFEPLEEYPGLVSLPWSVQCSSAGHQIQVRLATLRSTRKGCRHCRAEERRAARPPKPEPPPRPPRGVDPAAAADEALAAGMEPMEPYPGRVDDKWLVRCMADSCGHQWRPRLNTIRIGTGCPACAGQARITPERALAAIAGKAEALEPFPGNSSSPWSLRCTTCAHEFKATYANLSKLEGTTKGCARCSKVARISPAQAVARLDALGFDPLEPYPGTVGAKWRAKCRNCGRESMKTGSSKGRCTFCTPRKKRSITSDRAAAVARQVGFVPVEEWHGGYHEPWLVRCLTCGWEAKRTLGNMGAGKGCAKCAGSAPLTAEEAAARMESVGVRPLEPFPGTARLDWLVECLGCGYQFNSSADRAKYGHGCMKCNGGGIDPEKPAVLYLIVHDELEAVKVGIAGRESPRVANHERLGWSVVRVWHLATGRAAHDVEQSLLDIWAVSGVPRGASADDMPIGGWTETASLAAVDVPAVVDWIAQRVDSPGEDGRQLALW